MFSKIRFFILLIAFLFISPAFFSATGDLIYVSHTIDAPKSSGDGDRFGDPYETLSIDIRIKNQMSTSISNCVVSISTSSPYIDCIVDSSAFYGTIAASGIAVNPDGDEFLIHINPSVACSNPNSPPQAVFNISITGDGITGTTVPQSFTLQLDLDLSCSGNCSTPVAYTQNFNSNPGWTTGLWPGGDCDAYPDCTGITYINQWGWNSAEGNGNGGYGSPAGNGSYLSYNNGYLESPSFNLGPFSFFNMSFDRAYDFEHSGTACLDAAVVYLELNGSGNWIKVPMPGYDAKQYGMQTYCNPLCYSTTEWVYGGTSTWSNDSYDIYNLGASSFDSVKLRWRQGSDSSTGYAGISIDNFALGNTISGTLSKICDTKDNSVLGGCPFPPSAIGAPSANDNSSCFDTGVYICWSIPSDWGDYNNRISNRKFAVFRNGINISDFLPSSQTCFTDMTGTNGVSYTYTIEVINGWAFYSFSPGTAAMDEVGNCPPPKPVPDGYFIPGQPLRAVRSNVTGTNITISWDTFLCQATEYSIYYGDLPDVATYLWTGGVCSIGTSGNYLWKSAPSGNIFFIVDSNDGFFTEGSWGKDSGGNERGGTNSSKLCVITSKDITASCP